jgi:hypothetical protein
VPSSPPSARVWPTRSPTLYRHLPVSAKEAISAESEAGA